MTQTAASPRKKKAMAYLFLLLGGVFGAHRLYYEKWASGGAQLGLFCVGFALVYFRASFPAGLYFYSLPLNALGVWLLADLFLIMAWRSELGGEKNSIATRRSED